VGKKLGWILAAGLLVAGCGVGTVPAKDSGNTGVVETPTSTYSTPTYSVPVTTEAPASEAPIVTTAPATTKAAAPKVTATKPKTTAQAAPKPAGCGADYYRNSDGNCVHRPSDNPSGATALCKDGSYSYSQHRSGTCSGHGGVRTWL
jgi:uncharacterized protein DUF3761